MFQLLFLIGLAAASDVVDLTKKSFDSFVEAESLSLIEFYAPWCGHCKALAPEYEKAATTLKDDSIKLAKVDCTVEEELCARFSVQGFPTLKIFRHEKPSDYKGPRQADGIISLMKRQALPAISVLEKDKIEEFSKSDKVVLIGFFDNKESVAYHSFEEVANQLRDDFVFGATFSKEASKAQNVEAPALLLYKTFDEKLNRFTGEFIANELVQFIHANSVPNMDEIGPDNFEVYVKKDLPILYLFVSNEEERKEAGAHVEPLAEEYKGKISFVYLDASKYGAHAESVNLKQEWPALGLHNMKNNAKYPFDQSKKIVKRDVKSWLDSYLSGELNPSLKSEPVPESNDAPVKVIVGSTYESIVNDAEKDVFIEFYAPWCGHCQKLAPIWDELGSLMKTEKILIAKMDATANDLPLNTPFTIQGFPTLKLVKAETNQVVDFEGDRTLEAFIAFLKTNAHNGALITEDVKAEDASEQGDDHDEL